MKFIILSIIQVYYVASEFTLQPCSTKVDQILAGLTTNEIHYWDLKSLFSGSYLTYNLSTDQYNFFIQSPIYQYSNPIALLESINKFQINRCIQNKQYSSIITMVFGEYTISLTGWYKLNTNEIFFNGPMSYDVISAQIYTQGFAPVEFIEIITTKKQIYDETYQTMEVNLLIIGDTAPHTVLKFLFYYSNMDDVQFLSKQIISQLNSHYQAQAVWGAKRTKSPLHMEDQHKIIIKHRDLKQFGPYLIMMQDFNYLIQYAFANTQLSKDGTYYLDTIYRVQDAFLFRINNSAGEIYSQVITLKLYNELGEATAKINLVSTTVQQDEVGISGDSSFLSQLKVFV